MEIDVETGDIKVLSTAAAFNVGKVINPQLCEARLRRNCSRSWFCPKGGGAGKGSYESNYVDYKIPTAYDIPNKVTLVEIESQLAPLEQGELLNQLWLQLLHPCQCSL